MASTKASDLTLEEVLEYEVTNIKREYEHTETLYDAIEENDMKKMRRLLQAHPEFARTREPIHFYSPLHFAIKMNRIAIAKSLVLDFDARVDQLDKNQNTSLYYAVCAQSTELCDAFLSQTQTQEIINPLAQALKFQYVDIVKLFLKYRPDIIHFKNSFDMTIFHKAAEGGSLPIFMEICDHYTTHAKATKADFQKKFESIDRCGMNVFLHAVSSGSVDLVKHFVDLVKQHGYTIKFNCLSNLERSAMHYAIFSRNLDCVTYLHTSPMFTYDLNLQDSIGKTPLHYAVDKQLESIVKYLLDKKVRIDLQDKMKKKPIHYIKKGKVKNTNIATMLEMRRRETESFIGTIGRYIVFWLAAPRRFKVTLLILLVLIAIYIYWSKGILVI